LKDAFFAGLASVPDASAVISADAASTPQTEKVKPKLKLKKVEEDDPFASDDDKGEKAKSPAKPPAKANRASAAKGKPQKDESEDLAEEEEKVSGPKRAERAKKFDSDSEEYGEERPNKKREVR